MFPASSLLQGEFKKQPRFRCSESEEDDGEEEELEISSEPQAWGWIIGMMLLMGGASHVLVEAAIHLGTWLESMP